MKKVDKVKTAIVGCGMISNIYLRNLKNLFYIIDLVAVCDLNPASAEAKAHTYGVAEMAWAFGLAGPTDAAKKWCSTPRRYCADWMLLHHPG